MKKVFLKTIVATLSAALCLAPMGYAQTSANQSVAQRTDTQPLPGARKAAQFLETIAISTWVTAGVITAIALGVYVVNDQAKKDDQEAAIRAIVAAGGTTGTR